jgi:hypothetical protein
LVTLIGTNLVKLDNLALPIGELTRRFGELSGRRNPPPPPIAFLRNHELDLVMAAWLARNEMGIGQTFAGVVPATRPAAATGLN